MRLVPIDLDSEIKGALLMRQNYKFLLLAPPNAAIASSSFGKPKKSEQLHSHYLSAMQRLRGQVYLKDGAIQPADWTRKAVSTCAATNKAGTSC